MKKNTELKNSEKEALIDADDNYSHSIHEAAHAVIGYYLGAIIKSVTIVGPFKIDDPKNRTSHLHCVLQHPGTVSLDALTTEDVMLRLNVSLAPLMLDQKLTGRPSIGSIWDTVDAIRFFVWGVGNPKIRPIIESAQRAVDENSNDWQATALQFFEENSGPVRELLNCQPIIIAIEKLARQLLKRGRMSGFEVVRFLEKNWSGKLPEKAKPAIEHPVILKGENLENTLSAAERLLRMAFEILGEYKPENEIYEKIIEKASLSVLGVVFKLNDLLQWISSNTFKEKE